MSDLKEKEYFLMHKDIPVSLLTFDDQGNLVHFQRIEKNLAHFPIMGQTNDSRFHQWWSNRMIPMTRHGAKTALSRLGYENSGIAMVDNLALSLSDCYWIKPRGASFTWKDVNLYENPFSDELGTLMINENTPVELKDRTGFSVATSTGELVKKWCIGEDGRRYLIKGNQASSYQQSLNEVFASRLHSRLHRFPSVAYSLIDINTTTGPALGCMCYDFCDEENELLTAWEIMNTQKFKGSVSYFQIFRNGCLNLGIPEKTFQEFMDYLILTDYLLTNVDRHMNNIGIIRNPDTLKIKGFAPIYDCGNSMFYHYTYSQLERVSFEDIKTHSFAEKENRMLHYVSDFHVLDLSLLHMDFSLYQKDIPEERIRYPLIEKFFYGKLERIKTYQKK